MDQLPIELVYEILEFSGHGTLRPGYIRYDNTIVPYKFIFKLPNHNLSIKLIKRWSNETRVLLKINSEKYIEHRVSPSNIPNQLRYQIFIVYDQSQYYLTKYIKWSAYRMPTYINIFTEYI